MSDKFHTIVKRAVSLDIDVLAVAVGVGYFKQFIRIVAVLACAINLQLNSEESFGITIEDRLRLVAVVVDTSVTVYFLVIAFTAIVISVEMISVVLMQKRIAARTAGIMIFVAVMAKGGVLVPVAIVCPNY